jgi:hypothetical protein
MSHRIDEELYSFFNLGARWRRVVKSTPQLNALQDRSGRVREISPQPPFDPRTVQPVASRYTNYAIRLHKSGRYIRNVPVKFQFINL